MLYHCGLLSERPEKDATLQWLRRGWWHLEGTPPEIEFERRVWMCMPGFTASYHGHVFGLDPMTVTPFIGRDYDELRDTVMENWISCTREDAIKLAKLRPNGKGNLPVLCQLSIMDDLKQGMKQVAIARDYGLNPATITSYSRGVLRTGRVWLPEGFELIRL